MEGEGGGGGIEKEVLCYLCSTKWLSITFETLPFSKSLSLYNSKMALQILSGIPSLSNFRFCIMLIFSSMPLHLSLGLEIHSRVWSSFVIAFVLFWHKEYILFGYVVITTRMNRQACATCYKAGKDCPVFHNFSLILI